MVQYILKSALVAEIEKRKHRNVLNEGAFEEDIDILSFIDTLKVKEVDLDKSLTIFMSKYAYENGGEYPSTIDIAKHFFELGLKAAQKGE